MTSTGHRYHECMLSSPRSLSPSLPFNIVIGHPALSTCDGTCTQDNSSISTDHICHDLIQDQCSLKSDSTSDSVWAIPHHST
ncbi:hypothetical protein K503DRAFT_78323 [Rhizopogon vinicolor AM-OR11-026]|uniref:Uncharacterized protein n=1 Tax=Rhizopogon vinicolor AM-OR11-026 TaxID=1314800 RepID=A0A1B7MFZ5_9AGAM|nr:hypothetical protein K503DRAFT_78323 [Rhizopogon vinicolor AM-OR11-026]